MESEKSTVRRGTGTAQPKRGALHRFGATDLSVAGEVLKAATRYLVPEDMTQRQAFKAYMPELYILRNKGCSFAQIASLLADCGFTLQPATVRMYYSEMLAERLDECQRRMNEQILLLAEVRKETNAVDVSTVSDKLAEINERQRKAAAEKIEKLFGVREDQVPSPTTNGPTQNALAPREKNPTKPSAKKNNNPILEDEPGVPNLSPVATENPGTVSSPSPSSEQKNHSVAQSPAERPSQPSILRCLPLQAGVKPLTPKANVPAEVYKPGDLEHPAIPGLMLSLEQRLYGVALEYQDLDSGEVLFETMQEKRFRVFWQKPVAMSPSSTSDAFVKMDESLFRKP